MAPTNHENDFTARWVAAQPMISAYLASVVRDYHETEDLLQKVAVIAFQKQEEYDPARPFYAWAAGIARFELLRWRRDKARNKHIFTAETIEKIEHVSSQIHDELDDRRSALRFCIDKLDPKGRRFVEMHYVRSLAPSQIAQELGSKPGAIRVALHRVRELLHKCIDKRVAAKQPRDGGPSHG